MCAHRGTAIADNRVHITKHTRVVSGHKSLISLFDFHFFYGRNVENRWHVKIGIETLKKFCVRVVLLVELSHLYFLLAKAAINFVCVVREKWVTREGEHVHDVKIVSAVTTGHNVALLVVTEFAKVTTNFIVLMESLLVLTGWDGESKSLNLLFLNI